MKESFFLNQNSTTSNKNELLKDRQDLMHEKKENIEDIREQTSKKFEFNEKTKEFVQEAIEIRKNIRSGIRSNEYLAEIDNDTKDKIYNLAMGINGFDFSGQDHIFVKDESGVLMIQFEDGSIKKLKKSDTELIDSLDKYFDSFREVHNAARFRNNIKNIKEQISDESEKRKLNFYSEDDKEGELIKRVHEKYERAGFKEDEIKNLLEFADLKSIDGLQIHEIKMMSKIQKVFSRFMTGDKAKYVGLSVALMVPAFLDGYAPSFFANAFKKGTMEADQILMYALTTTASAAGSTLINKYFNDFSNKNYSKKNGFAEYASDNIAEFPGDEMKEFGSSRVRYTVNAAKYGFDSVLKTISFNVLPATVTLLTSATMLYEKSPMLAGGTALGGGLMFFVDKMVNKKGKFWQKEKAAEDDKMKAMKKIEQLLDSHLEVILAGEKDEFASEMKEFLSKERESGSERRFLKILHNKIQEFSSVINMIVASTVSYFSGGSPDKFIAALLYSGNINQGLKQLLGAKNDMLSALRDMAQMELMFNGYAEEEKEKEKTRIGIDKISNTSISLKNVGVDFGKRKILEDISLEIPQGSFVSLEGATGSGKTTLIKIISGYYKPKNGSVALGGVDVDSIKKSGDKSLYSKITYLSQFPYTMDDTIRNNLTFGVTGEVSDQEIRGILKEVGLNKRFPDLNERVFGGRGDLGSTSGGETSRIGLARAILKLRKNNSRIVFLDEPTASVDEETAAELAKIINSEKDLNPDSTFISISHDKHFRDQLNTSMSVTMKDGKISK